MKKYPSAPTAAVSSTGATTRISRLRRLKAALALLLALGLAGPEVPEAAPSPGAGLAQTLAPLLGQPFRVDGAQDEEGRWVTFNRPDKVSSAPGFNCSGFTVAAARLLLARPFTLVEATRDRQGDSGPGAPLGPDWDFGLDLILNLSEDRALRTLPETPLDLLSLSRAEDLPEFPDYPAGESPGPEGTAEFKNYTALESPGPGRGAADLPDSDFFDYPAVEPLGPGREAVKNYPAGESPGPREAAEFKNSTPLEPLGPGRALGWGVDLHSPEFENLLAQIRPGDFAFFCFSRPDGRFPAGVSYYHVGLIVPEPPHLWLYHSTLGAGTHRVDLAGPGRLARFRGQFPPPPRGERRVIMIEVAPPDTD